MPLAGAAGGSADGIALEAGLAVGAPEWVEGESAEGQPSSYWGRCWRRFLLDRLAVAALVGLLVVVALAVLAPWLAPASATDGDVALRLAPIGTPGHILGTDEQGRDMLSRLLHGARLTLLAGIVPVLAAGFIGGALGIIAGHFRGLPNTIIMRTMDVFYASPPSCSPLAWPRRSVRACATPSSPCSSSGSRRSSGWPRPSRAG
jgi:hypothetical protein